VRVLQPAFEWLDGSLVFNASEEFSGDTPHVRMFVPEKGEERFQQQGSPVIP